MTLGGAAEPLVHIKDFRMDFGDMTVIKDLSFDVRAGGTFEATIVIAELFILGLLVLRLAVYLFRYGSIEYGKKLSIPGTFRRRELAAK